MFQAEDLGMAKMTWVSHELILLLLLSHFSRVRLCATPQTAAHQAPPSLGFSRKEHWSGLPSPSPELILEYLNAHHLTHEHLEKTINTFASPHSLHSEYKEYNALWSLTTGFLFSYDSLPLFNPNKTSISPQSLKLFHSHLQNSWSDIISFLIFSI